MERVRVGYARLFEVRLLHHYWLDEGATSFDAIADDARTERLLGYDARRLFAVEPGRTTAETIAGLRGVFRSTGLGFLVAVPDGSVVPLDAVFEFAVTVTATDHATYTALSLRTQELTDVTDPATGAVHRYRANVPVLSNLTGAARDTATGRRLFLSREYPSGTAAGDGVEALVTSGSNLRQLTGDPPSAPFQVLGKTADQPVYVHQSDAPLITPPPGSSGAPPRGIELTADTPTDAAAIIRLAVRRDDDPAFSLVEADGSPRSQAPVFEVRLRNRWTTRRYRDSGDGSVTSTEADPRPLTYFGNAGTGRKPPIQGIAVELDGGDPPKITRLISDIYV